MKFLALISYDFVWKLYSLIIKVILVIFYNFKIGKNFFIKGTPILKLKGNNNIEIGNNVRILGDIDLRTRENGKLIILDNVKIEENCRFVVAKEGTTKIGNNTVIGANAIWNGGGNITIGKNCIFSSRSSINANEHVFEKKNDSPETTKFNYGNVIIEDQCFIGINTSISLNTVIGQGAIIGAHSFVNSNLESCSINVGVPAKKIKTR